MTKFSSLFGHVAGFIIFLLLWEVGSRLDWFGGSVPSVSRIINYFFAGSTNSLILESLIFTSSNALAGFFIGLFLSLALGCISAVKPKLKQGLETLAVMVNATPLIAVGPILFLFLGENATAIATAALATFFSLFVAVLSGLSSANMAQKDIMNLYSSGKFRSLITIQMPLAIPNILIGAKIGAGAAVLGAIIGEWFGASAGLGVLLIVSLQNFQVELLWLTVVVGTSLSGLGFLIIAVIETFILRSFDS